MAQPTTIGDRPGRTLTHRHHAQGPNKSCIPLDDQSLVRHTTAQATSTNANHRPESRSQRTCRRRQQLNQDSDRSTFQR